MLIHLVKLLSKYIMSNGASQTAEIVPGYISFLNILKYIYKLTILPLFKLDNDTLFSLVIEFESQTSLKDSSFASIFLSRLKLYYERRESVELKNFDFSEDKQMVIDIFTTIFGSYCDLYDKNFLKIRPKRLREGEYDQKPMPELRKETPLFLKSTIVTFTN